jgi:hypothetical protein
MTEISRRKTEMSRAEALQNEMAGAVRLLGSDGRNAGEANSIASRMTGLPVTVIERLRWKKIKRPFADVTDAVRDAVAAFNRRAEAKARHERNILAARVQALAALADSQSDQDFYRARLAVVLEQAGGLGLLDRPVAGPDKE